MKSLVGQEFERSTLQRYKTCMMHVKDFLQLKYQISDICLGNGWLTVDPYLNYKPKHKAVHREVLTKEELNRLSKKKFTVERLNIVRDMFVFCCYTGLAYVDVHKLKRSELVRGNRWRLVDSYQQAKNGHPF